MHYIKKILLVLQKVLHNTAPLNGLLSLKRAYSRRDLLLWFAGHAIKCYQCRSPKSWDDCVAGNDTTCASPLNSCVKVKLQTRRWKGWQKRELFRQSMCWKKELQQGRRLQACRTVWVWSSKIAISTVARPTCAMEPKYRWSAASCSWHAL